MKNGVVKILIFYLIFFSSFSNCEEELISAFSSIIFELFILPQIPFDVIIYKSTSSVTSDIINGIGSQLNGKILSTSKPLQLTQSAVIFTDNEKDLIEFLNKTELKNEVAKSLRFLFHSNQSFEVENLKIPLPTSDKGHIGHFSYYVINLLNEVQLKTLEWFTAQACHVQQTILINSYDKKNQEWNESLEIPPKFRNFHNCTMETFSRIYFYPSLEALNFYQIIIGGNHAKSKKEGLQPFDEEIAYTIAKQGNFKANILTGADKLHNLFHIMNLPRSPVLNDECHVGTIFSQDFETFVTTPADFYDSYEKMVLPFDTPTWWCLFATLMMAYIIISIINRTPEWIQDIVYGKGIRNAGINYIGFFFGLGQTKLPENNFARILLITHILFFMIFTTAYHGVFFQVMTTDVKKPLPQSLEDLYKMNYTIYCLISNEVSRSEQSHFLNENPSVIELNYGDTMFFFASLGDPTVKKALYYSGRAYEADKALWAHPPVLMTTYRYRIVYYGLAFMRNNFMYEVTEDTMSKLVQSGIPKYFESYINEVVLKPLPSAEDEPKVFGPKDLEFGFVIYLICCGISLTGFAMEVLYFNLKKLFGLLTLLRFSTRRV